MHRRLTETFTALGIDYEIIFVNDASPDDSERVIREISERDRKDTREHVMPPPGSAPGYHTAHHCTASGMMNTASSRSQLLVKSGSMLR